MTDALALAVLVVPLLGALLLAVPARPRVTGRANAAAALATATVATALALSALLDPSAAARGSWYLADAATGVFLLVIAAIGLLSALALPGYLDGAGSGLLGRGGSRRPAYVAFHLFWAALLLVPLAGNLAVAWLLVEATTAASALLVASSGRRGALEAGWKYLVLTTLGLTIALLGIVVLYAALGDGARLARTRSTGARSATARTRSIPRTATVAAVLILGGPGGEGRLGARAQLAARRAQRGAAAGQRAALGRAAADRRARRLARAARARRQRRRRRDAHAAARRSGSPRSRSRSRSCGGRCR